MLTKAVRRRNRDMNVPGLRNLRRSNAAYQNVGNNVEDRGPSLTFVRSILKGYPLVTKWNLAQGLTVGFLLSVGAAMYFNLASEGAAINPAAEHNRESTAVKIAPTYKGYPIDDDEWRFGPPYIEDFQAASVRPTSGKSVEIYPGDDEWVYGPPYLEVFPEHASQAYLTLEEFDAVATPAKVYRASGFLNQGRAGYSVREQMELLEEFMAARAPKADRPAGFLNQGRAGYSIKEQMEIAEETSGAIPAGR